MCSITVSIFWRPTLPSPFSEPWVTSLLSVLCRAFFQLGVVLKDSHLSQSLVPLSSPSPGRDTLSPSLGGTVQQVLYLPFFNTVCEPLGSEVTSVLLLAAAEEEALCEGPKSEGVAGRTKVAGSHFWGVV